MSLLGVEHPLSIHAAEVEALCLLEDDEEAAFAALSDVLTRTRLLLGPNHPQTLQAASNHRAIRAGTSISTVAVEEFEDIAERLGMALGEEHPDTLRVRNNVVIALLNSQGARSALTLCRRTVYAFRRVLGDDHPETIAILDLLDVVTERARHDEDVSRGMPTRESSSMPTYNIGFHGGEPPTSDRALKCRIDPVGWPPAPTQADDHEQDHKDGRRSTPAAQRNGYDILRAVAALPVSTWSYRGEEDVRHLDPMAQDWHASFGLGPDARSIHPVDANGVAIVAVQALHCMVQDLRQELEDLRGSGDARGDGCGDGCGCSGTTPPS
ncbi:tetratricopeptide repeat protein [Streptomyces sp. NPDC091289]|uniref:tetratricopeptide repeat protein n=1 Tax=Streptomyces sp. NPDC091289 TaxID=3365989 RepID=UPI0038107083